MAVIFRTALTWSSLRVHVWGIKKDSSRTFSWRVGDAFLCSQQLEPQDLFGVHASAKKSGRLGTGKDQFRGHMRPRDATGFRYLLIGWSCIMLILKMTVAQWLSLECSSYAMRDCCPFNSLTHHITCYMYCMHLPVFYRERERERVSEHQIVSDHFTANSEIIIVSCNMRLICQYLLCSWCLWFEDDPQLVSFSQMEMRNHPMVLVDEQADQSKGNSLWARVWFVASRF